MSDLRELSSITIGSPDYEVTVGPSDAVYDDLTRETAVIVKIVTDGVAMSPAVVLNNAYLEGWRHPWEVSPLAPNEGRKGQE